MDLRKYLVALLLLAGILPPAFAQDKQPGPMWIWGQPEAKNDQTFFFRKTFDTGLTADDLKNAKAVAWGTCDNELVPLYINGKSVTFSTTWERPIRVDATKFIEPGVNTIAIRARNDNSMAGLILRLIITTPNKKIDIVTDGSWKVSGEMTPGWESKAFNDASWKSPHVIGKLGIQPWGNLSGSDGRPIQATRADSLVLPPGFKAELLYSVPKETQGSWVSMTHDPKGRLIVSDQGGPLYRVTVGKSPDDTKVERINLPIGHAQGLLYALDSLYVTVNGGGMEFVAPDGSKQRNGSGLYRLRDTDNDDQFDKLEKLLAIDGSGEHGPHAIRFGPDGKIYLIAGNFTKIPATTLPNSPHRNWAEDHLLPRNPDGGGHDPHIMAPGGWIARGDPDGKQWELVCAGLRNSYDFDFNADGEIFTYDSDMEWDTGTPWYRPTRVLHLVSGAEYGWRNGTGKWPDYYPDSWPAVANTGLGSPTGVTFGHGARFPAKYQRAMFALDWTYGVVHAVHMTAEGASYKGRFEPFIQGKPFGVTDVTINTDGNMYVTIGGRGTQSGLYRISYTGDDATEPAVSIISDDDANVAARALRKQLEAFHGRKDSSAIDFAWPHLNSTDRFIRGAARIAIEWQDVSLWQQKALEERRPTASIYALIALIRSGDPSTQPQVLEALSHLSLKRLSEEQLLEAMRAYGLSFIRQGRPDEATARRIGDAFDALYPAQSTFVNRELVQVLTYLQHPNVVTKTMTLLADARTQEDQLHYAFVLRNAKTGWTREQRKAYFGWLAHAEQTYRGGASFKKFLIRTREDALKTVDEKDRPAIDEFLKTAQPTVAVKVLAPRQFVRNWQMQDLLPLIDQAARNRNFDKGKEAFEVAQCAVCHRFTGEGGATGPDLTGAGNRFAPADVLEAILLPNKVISDQYQNTEISTKDKDFFVGRIEAENDRVLTLRSHPLSPETVEIEKSKITKRVASKISMMPEGLVDVLTQEEILDLVAFIRSAGNPNDAAFKK